MAAQHGRGGGNPFVNPHGQGGYTGLGGILQLLQGGINQSQLDNLSSGYNGANGAVGGVHGAFSGLSPWAVHFLGTSGLLQKQAPNQISTDGLTGDDLFRATLQNSLSAMAPAQYKLHSGIDQSFLSSLFANGIGGHSAYRHGFDATGRAGGRSPMLPPRTPGGGLQGGMTGGMLGGSM